MRHDDLRIGRQGRNARKKWLNIRVLARLWQTNPGRTEILALSRGYRLIRGRGETFVSRASIYRDRTFRPGRLPSDALAIAARADLAALRRGER